jgi:hypothetical protein
VVTPQVLDQESRVELAVRRRVLVRLLPSFSDIAFLLPIGVLFSYGKGVGWLFGDSDTGWHIRTGEWILAHHAVPRTDLFSFSKAGQSWVAWEWLSDVEMGWLHAYGGLPAVALACLVVLSMTSLVVYWATRAAGSSRLLGLGVTTLAMGASHIHWLARPHLVTPLMAAVFCLTLNGYEKQGEMRSLLILPPLTALWANLHGGFVVGILIAITYAAGAFGEWLITGRADAAFDRARHHSLVAALCFVASLINPYGYLLHFHIAHYLGSPFYFAHVDELQPASFHASGTAWFETLLMLAVVAWAWHLRAGRLAQALLLVSWSHWALLSARNIPIFAAVAAPGVGWAASEAMSLVIVRSRTWVQQMLSGISELEGGIALLARVESRCVCVLPVVGVLAVAGVLACPGARSSWQSKFDESQFPVEAGNAVGKLGAAHELRVFSDWQWGGYLIYRLWPRVRVFNDGRTDFYGPAFIEDAIQVWKLAPGWQQILDRYEVNAALVKPRSALATALSDQVEWVEVYRDKTAALFVRNDLCKNLGEGIGEKRSKAQEAVLPPDRPAGN